MVSIAGPDGKAHCHGHRYRIAMRHLMTSFLTLHWAVFFALLGYLCVGGDHGVDVVLATLGARAAGVAVANQGTLVAAPLATAFLVVAALFCWAFIEVFFGDTERPEGAEGVTRMAFVAAGGTFSLILAGGVARGIEGLSPAVATHLAALMACYLAILGERRALAFRDAAPRDAARAVRALARDAANTSLLNRISGRPDLGGER
jgi:hypothetical protein